METELENKINESMEKTFEAGKIQGRMEVVNELIDLHDGGTEFLQALKEVQAKNGELMTALKEKSL